MSSPLIPTEFLDRKIRKMISGVDAVGEGIRFGLKPQIIEYADKRINTKECDRAAELKSLNSSWVFLFVMNCLDTNPAAKFTLSYPELVEELQVCSYIFQFKSMFRKAL